MTISFRHFEASDIPAMTPMMESAFNEDAMTRLGRNSGPDGYDDGSFLKKYTSDPASDPYVIQKDGIDIGALILWINRRTRESFLGCLFIDPEYHGRGLGTSVWRAIEAMYPETRVWRTETPLLSTRNLNFYINKCGFMAYRVDDPKSPDISQVQLVKYMKKSIG